MEKLELSKTEQFYAMFHKIFCCFPNKVKDNDELEIDFCINSGNNDTYQYADIINDIQSFFPIMYIREDEKNYFQFNHEFIINFISELSQKDFVNKYNDRSLILSILNKRETSDNIPVIRGEIIFKKSLFKKEIPTLESLASCILIPEKRLKVDKNFREFKILKKINNNTCITRMVSTSHIYQKNNDTERALNYFGIMVIKEDVENFYIDTFNKVDIKMNIPEVLIIMSFPMKMKEFSDGLLHYFNN